MTTFNLTWQFDISRAVSDYSTVAKLSQSTVWGVKSFLKGTVGGATLGLWSVYSCCDSVTVKTDGTDLWGNSFDSSKIVRAAAGVAHSWMCLKSPDTFGPWYMILDYSGGADNYPLNLAFSKIAPTGGTTTARPTASDEWTYTAAAGTALNNNTANDSRIHCMLSTRGDFAVLFSRVGSGFFHNGIIFIKVLEPYANDQYPCFSFFSYNAGGPFSASAAGGNWKGKNYNGSTALTSIYIPYLSDYGSGNVMSDIPLTGDATGGGFHDFPAVVHVGDANNKSIRGRLPDILLGPENPVDGSVEPLSGNPQSMIVGSFWFPTNAAPSL